MAHLGEPQTQSRGRSSGRGRGRGGSHLDWKWTSNDQPAPAIQDSIFRLRSAPPPITPNLPSQCPIPRPGTESRIIERRQTDDDFRRWYYVVSVRGTHQPAASGAEGAAEKREHVAVSSILQYVSARELERFENDMFRREAELAADVDKAGQEERRVLETSETLPQHTEEVADELDSGLPDTEMAHSSFFTNTALAPSVSPRQPRVAQRPTPAPQPSFDDDEEEGEAYDLDSWKCRTQPTVPFQHQEEKGAQARAAVAASTDNSFPKQQSKIRRQNIIPLSDSENSSHELAQPAPKRRKITFPLTTKRNKSAFTAAHESALKHPNPKCSWCIVNKKGCDGAKPCGRCITRGIPASKCTYPDPDPADAATAGNSLAQPSPKAGVDHIHNQHKRRAADFHSNPTKVIKSQLGCVRCRQRDIVCDGQEHCKTCIDDHVPCLYLEEPETKPVDASSSSSSSAQWAIHDRPKRDTARSNPTKATRSQRTCTRCRQKNTHCDGRDFCKTCRESRLLPASCFYFNESKTNTVDTGSSSSSFGESAPGVGLENIFDQLKRHATDPKRTITTVSKSRCMRCIHRDESCDRRKHCNTCTRDGIPASGCFYPKEPNDNYMNTASTSSNPTAQKARKRLGPRGGKDASKGPLIVEGRRLIPWRCTRCIFRHRSCDRQKPCGTCTKDGISSSGCVYHGEPGADDIAIASALSIKKTVQVNRCNRCEKSGELCDRRKPCGRCRLIGASSDDCVYPGEGASNESSGSPEELSVFEGDLLQPAPKFGQTGSRSSYQPEAAPSLSGSAPSSKQLRYMPGGPGGGGRWVDKRFIGPATSRPDKRYRPSHQIPEPIPNGASSSGNIVNEENQETPVRGKGPEGHTDTGPRSRAARLNARTQNKSASDSLQFALQPNRCLSVPKAHMTSRCHLCFQENKACDKQKPCGSCRELGIEFCVYWEAKAGDRNIFGREAEVAEGGPCAGQSAESNAHQEVVDEQEVKYEPEDTPGLSGVFSFPDEGEGEDEEGIWDEQADDDSEGEQEERDDEQAPPDNESEDEEEERNEEQAPPDNESEEEEYVIEAILSHTYQYNVKYYQVKWRDYEATDWLPAEELGDAQDMITEYEENIAALEG